MPANTTREILANLRKRETELLAELDEVRRVIAAVEPLAELDTLIPGQGRDTKESMRANAYPDLRNKYSLSKAKATRVVKFIEHCYKAGFSSMREACAAAAEKSKSKVPQAYISQCLADHDAKAAPLRIRKLFQDVIGYPVDAWPNKGD